MKIRAEALASAGGRVIEVGFGSGPNLDRYPRGVRSIVALEPNEGMLDRALPRVRGSRMGVHMVVGYSERLPLRDRTFDTAVSMLTLCSVSDPAAALMELRRVLRDDGRLIILEHGLSEDAGVARWQHRLNPVQRVLACGCHLNRPIVELVRRHGFRFDTLRQFYVPRAPRTHAWISVGVAVKA